MDMLGFIFIFLYFKQFMVTNYEEGTTRANKSQNYKEGVLEQSIQSENWIFMVTVNILTEGTVKVPLV